MAEVSRNLAATHALTTAAREIVQRALSEAAPLKGPASTAVDDLLEAKKALARAVDKLENALFIIRQIRSLTRFSWSETFWQMIRPGSILPPRVKRESCSGSAKRTPLPAHCEPVLYFTVIRDQIWHPPLSLLRHFVVCANGDSVFRKTLCVPRKRKLSESFVPNMPQQTCLGFVT